jgi:hypothetical protein
MGIFDSLKNAIFGSHPQTAAPSSRPAQPSTAAAPGARPAPAGASASPPASTPPSTVVPAAPVDVEAVLTGMAAKKSEKLNWQSSIVDLMKLVDLDPSLENRKTLAGELGYTGDTHDSASMNIWLHRQVMEKLAASGGRVPDSLRH